MAVRGIAEKERRLAILLLVQGTRLTMECGTPSGGGKR